MKLVNDRLIRFLINITFVLLTHVSKLTKSSVCLKRLSIIPNALLEKNMHLLLFLNYKN